MAAQGDLGDLPEGLTSIGQMHSRLHRAHLVTFQKADQHRKVHSIVAQSHLGDVSRRVDQHWTVGILECTGLTSVTFQWVDHIGESAFFGTELTSVTFPEGLTSIGESAFFGCTGPPR